MSNAIDYTKSNITTILLGVTKLTSRTILLDLKQNRVNYTLITSNA